QIERYSRTEKPLRFESVRLRSSHVGYVTFASHFHQLANVCRRVAIFSCSSTPIVARLPAQSPSAPNETRSVYGAPPGEGRNVHSVQRIYDRRILELDWEDQDETATVRSLAATDYSYCALYAHRNYSAGPTDARLFSGGHPRNLFCGERGAGIRYRVLYR